MNVLTNLRTNLKSKNITVLFCDIQDKYTSKIYKGDNVIKSAGLMADICNIHKLNHIVTEQVPKVFGTTHKEITSKLENSIIREKTLFSMLSDSQIKNDFSKDHSFILLGIEAHICIYQTAFKLLEHKKNVILIKDAISSTTKNERELALSTLNKHGAELISLQCLSMFLLEDSKNELFKENLKIMKSLVEFKNELI